MYHHSEEVVFSIVLGTALLLFFVVLFVFTVLQFQKKQLRNRLEREQMQREYEQAILHVQIEVQNTTLQHIGEELHDNIGQLLSVVRINLNVVEESKDSNRNLVFIKQANELVAQSIREVRALTKSLDGDFVKDFGLTESITQELQRIRNTRLFETELQLHGDVYSLGFQREIVLYRVIQETLQNAIKHSGATQLTIDITYTPTLVSLTIADNGIGFNYQIVNESGLSQSGAGLRNIQRRVTLIGGTCTFISAEGSGTRVVITLSNPVV